jgi:hypothetical protein
MVLQVSDTVSNRRDQIANYAEILRNASARQAVFNAVYRGKKEFKTVIEVAGLIGGKWTAKRVATVGKPLAQGERLFEQERLRVDGKVQIIYRKIHFVERNKRGILRLANNKKKLEGYHTKTNPRGSGGTQRIVVHAPFRIKTRFVMLDEVDQFSKVRQVKSVPSELSPARLSESQVKAGLLKLLKETIDPKDWGGERNDIFTTRLRIHGRSLRGAFALKGPAKTGPLVPGMMGTNGDQIQRLFDSPADAFFVQYEGEIKETVIKLMEDLAKAKALFGREVFFGVIDLDGTYRLRLAYPSAFKAK